jgi:outer membrane murein-binding lipoprotein Lpp
MITRDEINSPKKITVLLIGAAIFLSGCVQTMPMTSNAAMTPEEQMMRQQGDAFNKTVVEGAAVGAVAGALAGLLINRDVKGALVGAASGAVLGGGTGYYLAQKQKQYASNEQRMDAMIADVRTDNEKVAGLIRSSKDVIAADMQRIDQLNKGIASGNITKENAKRELARVEENEKYLQKTIGNLKKKQIEWEEIASQTKGQGTSQQTKALNGEINKLEKQVASMEKELDSLVQRRKVVPVA